MDIEAYLSPLFTHATSLYQASEFLPPQAFVSSFIKKGFYQLSPRSLNTLRGCKCVNPLPFTQPLLTTFGLLESHTCVAGLVSNLTLRALRVWFVDSGISCFKKIQYTNVNISKANQGVAVCILTWYKIQKSIKQKGSTLIPSHQALLRWAFVISFLSILPETLNMQTYLYMALQNSTPNTVLLLYFSLEMIFWKSFISGQIELIPIFFLFLF